MTRAVRTLFALLCTSVLVALAAGGTVGVGTAFAEEKPGEQCNNAETFQAEGSTLQKIAQKEVWTVGFNTNAEGCEGTRGLGKKPKVEYNADGSGAGLKAFGVGKAEECKTKKDLFIGTDEAPNETQLKEIDEQCSEKTKAAGQAIVIPVVQAAIAMIYNPPEGCTIKNGRITNEQLQKIWARTITKWSELTGAEPKAACEVLILRVVREDGSGTTYQFKHYLFELNKGAVKGTKTWHELQAEPTANLEWPEEAGEKDLKKANGGGALVKAVEGAKGSIGYANLGDARGGFAGGVKWFAVENTNLGTFVFPGTTKGEPAKEASSANCEGTEYPSFPKAVAADGNWSEIYGGKPAAANYPICTLTWDVALKDYGVAGYGALAHNWGQTAYDYLMYVTTEKGGQKEIGEKHDYSPLPNVTQKLRTLAEELALIVN